MMPNRSSLAPSLILLEQPSAHSDCCYYSDSTGLSDVPSSSILHRQLFKILVTAVTVLVLSLSILRILLKEHSNYVSKSSATDGATAMTEAPAISPAGRRTGWSYFMAHPHSSFVVSAASA